MTSSTTTDPRPWRRRVNISLLFIGLTAMMTWPQVRVLATHASDHQDVYFNMWRFAWIAHALLRSPLDLFNGNQFYPEKNVLAYSDAMLVEGLLAAPMVWVGVPPVLVHNLMLLGAIVASAVGMYVLARHVSGSHIGGVAAGIVFAFAPYRFDHYMHMELQWAVWMPWAFWALQRTIETGAMRFGVMTGVFVALQVLSSVYYGIFLGLLIGVVTLLQLIPLRRRHLLACLRSLAVGGVIAAGAAGLYSIPYTAAAERVGTRHASEVTRFSARPRDYRAPTPNNVFYQWRYGVPERQLFPGLLAPVLALIGLLLVPPTPAAIAFVFGLAVAFELSLGMYGQLYPFLYDHVNAFRGLRAPARASIFVLMFLGVLAARGYASLGAAMASRGRAILGTAICAFLLLEYWVAPLHLIPFANEPPPLYAWLAQQPKGIVAEFPMPRPGSLPGHDFRYLYMSTFHWMPLVNGYSGYYPRSYIRRITAANSLPDARAIEQLRSDGVRYVIVHSDGYKDEERTHIIQTLALEHGLGYLGEYRDGWGEATVFALE